MANERHITTARHGHILTNVNVWSPDGRRIVYDVRSDPAGSVFDGTHIETIDVETGNVRVLYESTRGACCGVVTYSPANYEVAFILGPEDPTPDWSYGPSRRRGVIVAESSPGICRPLDARDMTPPFTPGALRGGSHVHVFDAAGSRVSFTYEDEFLERHPGGERNRRTVAVAMPYPVPVPRTHPRNRDGEVFSVVAVQTTDNPRPGSDDIVRAVEDAWVGDSALAFQGHVAMANGTVIPELFIVDIPDDLRVPGDGPLQGTATTYPCPPLGAVQRRLTFTADRSYPGLQGPRHWPRSSRDGSRIAFLMRDDSGVVQLWTVAPTGGPPRQLTHNPFDVASAFTWNRAGSWIAHVMDGSVCVTDATNGTTRRLTPKSDPPPRPEACVFSPDDSRVAYVRTIDGFNQVFVCGVESNAG